MLTVRVIRQFFSDHDDYTSPIWGERVVHKTKFKIYNRRCVWLVVFFFVKKNSLGQRTTTVFHLGKVLNETLTLNG